MSQISTFSFTPVAQIGLGVLLSCILRGLDVQNQERNCCLDPAYFTEIGIPSDLDLDPRASRRQKPG